MHITHPLKRKYSQVSGTELSLFYTVYQPKQTPLRHHRHLDSIPSQFSCSVQVGSVTSRGPSNRLMRGTLHEKTQH